MGLTSPNHEKTKQPIKTTKEIWLHPNTLSCLQVWLFMISGRRCKP